MPEGAADADGVSALVRAALFVRSIERSTAFYRDVLGLAVTYWEGPLEHPAAAALVGAPAGSLVAARILKAAGPSFGMVGLFEVRPAPPALPPPAPGEGIRLGEAVLVFYAPDLDPIVARLEAGGHPMLCPPTFLQVTPGRGQREMTCRDPDGFAVNLIERAERLA